MIRIVSLALPKSPMSLARGDEVPQIITPTTYQQSSEFLTPSAKRLLQQYLPISEVNDSFDHLVGERQQCRGNGNAERFRGFEIDHEGKLARLLDREIAGPGASKDFAT
jgi:hypothetical protein